MKAFLVEGYLDAFRGLGAAVKLFWPILIFFLLLIATTAIVGNFKFTSNFETEPLIGLAIFGGGVAVVVYVFIMLCQGAVGWHRWLLLDERPRWASLVPSRRSLSYALPAFLFALIMWIALFLFSALVLKRLAAQLTASIQGINLSANPTIEQLDAFRWATMPIQFMITAGMIVIVGAVLWAGRAWLLIFPHVSVRTDQPAWGALSDTVRRPPGFLGALMVAMFLPSILQGLYQSFVPMSLQLSLWVATPVSIASILLAILSLLGSLSILSIAYRKAEVDKIPFGEARHEAQS